jgi:hypothetical protein
MAFVAHCDHDVFVSYASIDNEAPASDTSSRWVDYLVDVLRVHVAQRLGSSVDIWRDRDLALGQPVTEVLEAARRSALLLIVMSPAYVRSAWCARERSAFLDVVRERSAQDRVFVVNALDVPRAEQPPELVDVVGYDFFVHDSQSGGAARTLGAQDRRDSMYLRSISALSADVAEALRRAAAKVESAGWSHGRSERGEIDKATSVAHSGGDIAHAAEEVRARDTAGVAGAAEIFISYAREDETRVRALSEALGGRWSVFWDRRVPTGRRWRDHIGKALLSARCVIVAWSRYSVESDFVLDEARRAQRRGLLVPVLLEDVEPPLGFGELQAADLTDWQPGRSSAPFELLLADIAQTLGAPLAAGRGGASARQDATAPHVTSASRSPLVFLSYAREDREVADLLTRRLEACGIRIWKDAANLVEGDMWIHAARRVIGIVDYVVVLQSTAMRAREGGALHVEIRHALERAMHFAQGIRFVMPVMLDEGPPLESLAALQAVDMRSNRGVDDLVRSIADDWSARQQSQASSMFGARVGETHRP